MARGPRLWYDARAMAETPRPGQTPGSNKETTMVRKHKQTVAETETTEAPIAETPAPETPAEPDPVEQAAIAEIDAQIALPRSVVGRAYKIKYKERAIAEGRRGKAHKRCNGDWLALELMAQTLDDKEKLIVEALEAILTANGIKHEGWNRTTNGWQGRLRMTGRMALQRRVAETGVLVLADGETLEAPADWVAKHTH